MPTPLQILKKYWNYDAFRPLQLDIIESVLDGRDTLALLPTGGGKSICFQIPALVLAESADKKWSNRSFESPKMPKNGSDTGGGASESICIVVSPLIALMKDQVEQLKRRDIPAVAVHAGMRYGEVDRILDNAVFGAYRFIYLSPERLLNPLVRERIKRMKVSLLAVDEAHCISQWGYDFRPSYLEIAAIRDILLPEVPILALTATATSEVVEDIQEKLQFKKKNLFQQDFDRPNLSYIVRKTEDKARKIIEILKKSNGSGIVYVRSRKGTKEISNMIRQHGIGADFYHAGLDFDERTRKQNEWISGKNRIIVATNAFGMGIDKPDVRVVVHLDLPDTLEAYFQEAGRAGRDGGKSYCVLLFNEQDAFSLNLQFKNAFPDLSTIRRVYAAICSYYQLAVGSAEGESFDFDLVDVAQRFSLDPMLVHAALKVLEQDGWFALTESVFSPSTLQSRISAEEIYDFQLKNPEKERVLKGILRLLGGTVFSNPTTFSEQQLATFLKMPLSEIEKILHWLHANQVFEYRKRSDKPQLTFLRPRESQNYLDIDRTRYEFRRKRHEIRLKAALEYAQTPICRSRQLLSYFGQTDITNCGVCDVCVEKKQDVSTDEIERIENKIKLLLRYETLTLHEMADAFGERQREKVLQVVSLML
ncbi:MAG: hypothetical protein RL757_590, partial [Bacteroidota bacterium]